MVKQDIRESVNCRDVGTCPLSLNKCNVSQLSNRAAVSSFRTITWLTSVSRHDDTLKSGNIHRYSDICEIAKTPCQFLRHILQ